MVSALLGAVEQEPAAADGGGDGIGHGQREGHGNAGIDGVAARAQDLDAGPAGIPVGSAVATAQTAADEAHRRSGWTGTNSAGMEFS